MAKIFKTQQLGLSGRAVTTDSNSELYIDGERLLKASETGGFSESGHAHDHLYYPLADNISGYVTGDVIRPSDTGNFLTHVDLTPYIQTGQTGDFATTGWVIGLGYITGVETGHNHDEQYYPLTLNPSGYVTGDVVRPNDTGIFYLAENPSGFITGYEVPTGTETGILNTYLPIGYILYDTEKNKLVLSLGEESGKYRLDWPFSHITGVDMGPDYLENNRRGYGLGYVTDKLLANIKIGGNAISGDGALKFVDGSLQLYTNERWNNVVVGFYFREDSTGNYEFEHRSVGFDTWLNAREGTSNELGIDGLPLIRGYHSNMGPYGQDLVIDGGDGR